ncbi:hypothetical protein [Oceanicoccus sp. KOV_DT_Chl]|uniref:hypothetical protein n=1 Tax=Oceanicoccus sp. KOV_DT_Chl TaxID=1904639 RepID=UPI0011AF8D38|nr:hypothetical protein [Oceanicoccus sp. KOV_DT_Chl]
MIEKVDPLTPVLVGVGVAQQRNGDPLEASEVYQLMVEAVETAAVDAGSEYLLVDAERIAVPRGMWAYSDPARIIADEIGATNATTVLAEIGVLQQSLIADACVQIANGEIDIAIVAGGEAKYRQLRSTITNTALDEDFQQADVTPDITLTPEAELWSPIEANAGLAMPVGYYALMESALCHARGVSVEQHRDSIAELYENFSLVAVDNPHAWNRNQVSAEEIRNPQGKNKMLAFPYTKLHNSQWNVDQAAGLIFCSVQKARALGIPESKWIYPLASTESNHMVNTSQRTELHRCKGAKLAGKKALELSGLEPNELTHLDLYSCFPAAVQIYADELGIHYDQSLTVTGGMTFGGGPLNNYVLQATCRIAELLREGRAVGESGNALVTSVSGMLTKQGFGVWSNMPATNGFQFADVTAQTKSECHAIELVDGVAGKGRIVACTVLFNGDDASRAIAVCDVADAKRTVVYSEDIALMQKIQAMDLCGEDVLITAGNTFSLV